METLPRHFPKRRLRAFPGKVDTGFPKGNATNIESRALPGHSRSDALIYVIGKRSRIATGRRPNCAARRAVPLVHAFANFTEIPTRSHKPRQRAPQTLPSVLPCRRRVFCHRRGRSRPPQVAPWLSVGPSFFSGAYPGLTPNTRLRQAFHDFFGWVPLAFAHRHIDRIAVAAAFRSSSSPAPR